jgi:hemolysin activation/secretion protein
MVCALALLVAAPAARAQVRIPVPRPSDERPAPPPFETEPSAPVLPAPPPPPAERAPRGEAGELRFRPRAVRVAGATALSPQEIAGLTAPWVGREVGTEDLLALCDALTRAYVERGHPTSGAYLPDQRVADGVVEVQVVEGGLARIEVEGLHWLRPRYVRSRIGLAADRPLDVAGVERELQRLLQDPRIETLHAELVPGPERGEAILRVRAEEAFPLHAVLEGGNLEPPSVGAWRAGGELWTDDLTGLGDVLRIGYGWTRGLDDFQASYTLPWNPWDGAIGAQARLGDSRVTESPFDVLAIESTTSTVGFFARQPFLRGPRLDAALLAGFDWRETEGRLLGERFSFTPESEDGRTRLRVLRAGGELALRDRSQVLAARALASVGLDVWDATRREGELPNGDAIPDGRFLAFLLQAQWARRLGDSGLELLAGVTAQLAASPLPTAEQFALGGLHTVRGYRENQLVRDSGVSGTLELRWSALARADGTPVVQIVPFVDAGTTWNVRRATPDPRWLGGAGIGLRWNVWREVWAEGWWAARLRPVDRPPDRDLQDYGVHLRLVARLF